MTAENPAWDSGCVVCGKSVDHGGGLCHIKFENTMIALCCPLCVETFNQDPKPYLRKRAARQLERDLHAPGASALFDL